MKRTLPIALLLLFCTLAAFPVRSQQSASQTPSTDVLKAFFPASRYSPDKLKNFRSWRIDFNGDGSKEWLIVENPNQRKKKVKKGPQTCPCPKPKIKDKLAKKAKNIFRKDVDAIYNIAVKSHKGRRKRKRHDIKIWFAPPQGSKRTFEEQMDIWARRLGRKYRSRKYRKWRLRNFILIDNNTGRTAQLSMYRCRRLSRMRKKKYRMRRLRRWLKALPITRIKRCPCPKKKKKPVVYKAPKPLTIIVAKEVKPKAPTAGTPGTPVPPPSTPPAGGADTGPQLKLIGRYTGSNVQLSPLTDDNKIIGLRVERTTRLSNFSPQTQKESLYMYDEGGSGRMKEIFTIQTSKDNLDREADARQWTSLTFRNMDGDSWMEILADTYYETPQFNGVIQRQMYKWKQGRYVSFNRHRGILKVTASSTWKRIAPKASANMQRRLRARTSANNAADGFRNTPWVGAKSRRGLGDWLNVQFMRNQKLVGVAISVKLPNQFQHTLSDLYSGTPPKLVAPRYVRIQTGSVNMTTQLDPNRSYNFIPFPRTIWARYVKVSIVGQHRQGKQTLRLNVPQKEKSLAFISEIVPIFAKISYSASSFEYKGASLFTPDKAGDNRMNTAWAEGRSDAGIGEWLQLLLPIPKQLNALVIVNGCKRAGESYTLNNRIQQAELRFSNGLTQTITLKDSHKPQTIKLTPVRSTSVKLTIRSIYKGKLGHTTCLSEMRLK